MMAYLLDDERSRAMVESTVPRGRIGTPEDIAGAVLFLCSRAGAYLTGAVIPSTAASRPAERPPRTPSRGASTGSRTVDPPLLRGVKQPSSELAPQRRDQHGE